MGQKGLRGREKDSLHRPLSVLSSNSYRSPRKKSLPLWSHHLAFCTVVTITLKYSIKQHSWEWPRFHVCLLYLWIWAVGRINSELLLKLTPVFPGVGVVWISLAASLPLLHSEKLTGRCSPKQWTEVKLFLSFDWSGGGVPVGHFLSSLGLFSIIRNERHGQCWWMSSSWIHWRMLYRGGGICHHDNSASGETIKGIQFNHQASFWDPW